VPITVINRLIIIPTVVRVQFGCCCDLFRARRFKTLRWVKKFHPEASFADCSRVRPIPKCQPSRTTRTNLRPNIGRFVSAAKSLLGCENVDRKTIGFGRPQTFVSRENSRRPKIDFRRPNVNFQVFVIIVESESNLYLVFSYLIQLVSTLWNYKSLFFE
jgi:hypothetical protein